MTTSSVATAEEPAVCPRVAPPGGWGALFAACAVFLLATVAMFGDVLFTGRGLVVSKAHEDLADIFIHWQAFGFAELRKGNLPLWNPHVFAGAPYLGGFQPALLYPPNWIGLLLPLAAAINVGVALHIFLAGLWTYLWAAYRRLHPAACIFAGIVFMFCGAHFLQIYRGHLPNLRTVSWAPLVLLVADGLVRAGARPWLWLGMAVVALQLLAGHVQEFFYTWLIVSLYVACQVVRSPQRWHALVALAAVYAGAACLAAVQLFTGLDAIAESLRTGVTWEIVRSFAFPPENVVTLVLPGVFGDMIQQQYWGRWTLSEMSLFIGTTAFLCALQAIRHGAREQRRFSFAIALVALVLAFGYYTPLHRFLYDYVPGFGGFRGTTKFTFLVSAFLAMLAGVGLDTLLTDHGGDRDAANAPGAAHDRGPRPADTRFVVRVAAIACLVLLVAAAAILLSLASGPGGWWERLLASVDLADEGYTYYRVDRSGDFVARAGRHAATSMLIAAGSFALLAALYRAARRRRIAIYVIAIFGFIELFAYARYSRPTFELAPLLREREALRGLYTRDPGDYRILGHNPYLAMSAGGSDVYGFDPTLLARYAEFLAEAQGMQPHQFIVTRMGRVVPLLGMLRLRYTFRADGASGHARYTNLNELPRALLVPAWRVVPDERARLTALTDPAFDPRATVLLETDPGPAVAERTSTFPPPASSGSVVVTDVDSDVLEIRAEVAAPAILLLTDNYSAGWRVASLSARPAQDYAILPADHTLRGIPLMAGTHHLRLEYRPRGFVVGTWVTVFAVLAWVLAVAVVWRHHRRDATALKGPGLV